MGGFRVGRREVSRPARSEGQTQFLAARAQPLPPRLFFILRRPFFILPRMRFLLPHGRFTTATFAADLGVIP